MGQFVSSFFGNLGGVSVKIGYLEPHGTTCKCHEQVTSRPFTCARSKALCMQLVGLELSTSCYNTNAHLSKIDSQFYEC